MNERQRILDLVNQGILTSEEALVLLENLAKNDQDVKSNPTETATEQTEQPTADKSAIEEKAHELTVNLSGVNRQLQDLKQAMHADQEQVTVLDTMEDLDSLSRKKQQNGKHSRLAYYKSKLKSTSWKPNAKH